MVKSARTSICNIKTNSASSEGYWDFISPEEDHNSAGCVISNPLDCSIPADFQWQLEDNYLNIKLSITKATLEIEDHGHTYYPFTRVTQYWPPITYCLHHCQTQSFVTLRFSDLAINIDWLTPQICSFQTTLYQCIILPIDQRPRG